MTEAATGFVQLVLAPNPGPMTLEGTNTWILGDVTRGAPAVVDPGPLDDDHLRRVLAVCGGEIAGIVLTHRHHDHSDGIARLVELSGCAVVRAADPHFRSGPYPLIEGETWSVPGGSITAYATPGHTSDSMSLIWTPDDGTSPRLLSGDMVLGRGTTVIAHPDGDLGDYLNSLDRMKALVRQHSVSEILPGHGSLVVDPVRVLDFYARHRQERLEQVRLALAAGDRGAAEIVARVYRDVDPSLWPAAEQSVQAQLNYLNQ